MFLKISKCRHALGTFLSIFFFTETYIVLWWSPHEIVTKWNTLQVTIGIINIFRSEQKRSILFYAASILFYLLLQNGCARLRNKYCFALLMASHEICCVMAKCLILFLSLNSYKIVSILNVSKPTSSPMMVSHTINWK